MFPLDGACAYAPLRASWFLFVVFLFSRVFRFSILIPPFLIRYVLHVAGWLAGRGGFVRGSEQSKQASTPVGVGGEVKVEVPPTSYCGT